MDSTADDSVVAHQQNCNKHKENLDHRQEHRKVYVHQPQNYDIE